MNGEALSGAHEAPDIVARDRVAAGRETDRDALIARHLHRLHHGALGPAGKSRDRGRQRGKAVHNGTREIFSKSQIREERLL